MGMQRNTFRKVRYPDPEAKDYNRPSNDRRPVKTRRWKGASNHGRKLCGKRRYEDEYAASYALKRARKWAAQNGRRAPVRWYYHKKCNGYHLTSTRLGNEEEAA